MTESEPRTPEEYEKDFKHRIGFKYAIEQTEIMRQALHGNNENPVGIFYSRYGNKEFLFLDKTFLCTMAGGSAGYWQEMRAFGLKEYADHILETTFKDDVA